jgi:hypothetical protein
MTPANPDPNPNANFDFNPSTDCSPDLIPNTVARRKAMVRSPDGRVPAKETAQGDLGIKGHVPFKDGRNSLADETNQASPEPGS